MQDDDKPAAALARLRWQGTSKAYRRDHARMMAARSAATRRERVKARERGVCPLCHAETEPGELVRRSDGACWPSCLGR